MLGPIRFRAHRGSLVLEQQLLLPTKGFIWFSFPKVTKVFYGYKHRNPQGDILRVNFQSGSSVTAVTVAGDTGAQATADCLDGCQQYG